MAIVAIIPARFGSTRLPGKPLSDIHGKPMIQHVHERVRRAQMVDRILVATDDERIASAVRAFGGEAVMTSSGHATGTDRLAEAVAMTDAAIVVNVQGDEPMLEPAGIDRLAAALRADSSAEMATVSLPLLSVEEMLSPHVVKVVSNERGDALYFSRSPLPYCADARDRREAAEQAIERGLARKHVGLYAYRRETLLRLAALPRSPLEKAEALEQLRALENGIRIAVIPLQGEAGIAVDTPADLERVRARLAGVGSP